MKLLTKAVALSEQRQIELASILVGQQKRVIMGIHNNQGILTHDATSMFYCNNIPDVVAKTAVKLFKVGLKIVCKPQSVNPKDKAHSWKWYLCRL